MLSLKPWLIGAGIGVLFAAAAYVSVGHTTTIWVGRLPYLHRVSLWVPSLSGYILIAFLAAVVLIYGLGIIPKAKV